MKADSWNLKFYYDKDNYSENGFYYDKDGKLTSRSHVQDELILD